MPPADGADPAVSAVPAASISATALLELAGELVAVPSVSGEEAALAALVERRLRAAGGLEVIRVGDNVVARNDPRKRGARLLLAGHLDTVPPFEPGLPGRIEGGVLSGLGAVDMKGGLAVLLALACRAGAACRLATFVFYAREEVARSRSGLLEVAAERPELLEAEAAVLAEPTRGVVEAGCQGVLRLEVRLGGRRAHTARPWTGVNAVHRLRPLLALLERYEARQPVLDGCRYRESLQAVAVEGGVAANVVPDAVRVVLSHRFAPDRDAAAAEAAVAAYLGPALDPGAGDALAVEESAPAARPALDHPDLAALVAASGAAPRAKLGWTDVAFFAERGVPAANFGPGDPLLAHTPDERLAASELEPVARKLARLLAAGTAG